MPVRIKFCGLTRPEDVAAAAELGADYVGVIFAGGPRNRTLEQATRIFEEPESARAVERVGVFGAASASVMHRYMTSVPLSIAQLHGDASPASVLAARAIGVREVWAVVPVRDGALDAGADDLFQCADAVVLDTGAASGLGGTGRSFDWQRVAEVVAGAHRTARLVVAGGLNPENVRDAIRCLMPDVVDVSSGVESAPGVKDPILMSRFVEAVRSA